MKTMLDKIGIIGDVKTAFNRLGIDTLAVVCVGGSSGTAVKVVTCDTVGGDYTDFLTLKADALNINEGFCFSLIGAKKFVKMLVNRGHEAMLEHVSVTVKFTCDRGISHEIVRHRLCSFAQESTRYVNYSSEKKAPDGIIFIKPLVIIWIWKMVLHITGKEIERKLCPLYYFIYHFLQLLY